MFGEIKLKAKGYYDNKEYNKALESYEKLKNQDSLEFEKSCSINYMWCIYRVKITSKDAFSEKNYVETKRFVKYILEHSTNKDKIFQYTVFKVLKHIKNKNVFNPEKVDAWLNMLNAKVLSGEITYIEQDGRKVEFQSNKEEWYALKSRVYEKLKLYEKCIEVSEEAISILPKLHNDNEIWFKRRIAISKHKLGDNAGAINALKELLRYKSDWFLHSDISEIYLKMEDNENAIKYGINALLKYGDEDKKVKLFWNLGIAYENMGDIDKSHSFKDYSIKIRIAKDWKQRDRGDYYNSRKQVIDNILIEQLGKNVIEIANNERWSKSTIYYGEIAKILSNAKSGFIESKRRTYYFKFNEVKGKKSNIRIGQKVQFYAESSFDIKKNKETETAVNIKLIN